MPTFRVDVRPRPTAATLISRVDDHACVVEAPDLVSACYRVLRLGARGAALRAMGVSLDGKGQAQAFVSEGDAGSVRRAAARAGLGHDALVADLAARLGVEAADRDDGATWDAVADHDGDAAARVASLRAFAETRWRDEEGKGHVYLQDLVDCLDGWNVPEQARGGAVEAYWERCVQLVQQGIDHVPGPR